MNISLLVQDIHANVESDHRPRNRCREDSDVLETEPHRGVAWSAPEWQDDACQVWATHQGAELDLLLFKRGRRIGVECKRVDAPAMTRSMPIAMEDLKLGELRVVYPGERRYTLSRGVDVVPLVQLAG